MRLTPRSIEDPSPMLSVLDVLLRLGLALLLSGLIGIERERKNRPAGLRTHMLTGLSAAALMILSVDFIHYQPAPPGRAYLGDPGRIASYVLAALGFLGAGTILRGPGGVMGLTTAATLWLVTALGLAAGAGMFALAGITAGAALFVLLVLRYFEHRYIDRPDRRIRRRVTLVIQDGPQNRGAAVAAMHAVRGRLVREALTHGADRRTLLRLDFNVDLADGADYNAMHARLEALPGLRQLEIRKPKPGMG
jgi:putative Mg2+ transporter-C (MgtC) family protein